MVSTSKSLFLLISVTSSHKFVTGKVLSLFYLFKKSLSYTLEWMDFMVGTLYLNKIVKINTDREIESSK